MLKKIIKKFSVFIILFPSFVFATSDNPPSVLGSKAEVVTFLEKVGGWMYGILLLLAVIFIIYGGYMFLFAGGEKEKVEKAKKIILYAIIAIVVAILANGIVSLTQEFLIGSSGPGL